MSEAVPPSGSSSPLVFKGAVLAGRYRLEGIVGAGGMGAVWSATHLGIGQQVALKLVYANFVRSADALQRFDREAKAAARIKSRHVPQVYDNGVLEDGTPFLAMELLQGETLFTRVHQHGPVPLPEAISILDQCCRALGRAHALGIVHRDIKPDNIFLAHQLDEEGYVVKVLDFGIAKFTLLGEGEHSSTRTGALLGTPQYMSPEQARALKTIDQRTDLYSLGLVAYTMLTGNLAFSGESLGDLLLQICAQPLPSLVNAAPWLPPAMETWFQIACAREPNHRYPSAQALIDGLRAAAAAPHAPALSQPTGPGATIGSNHPSLGVPSATGASSLAIEPGGGARPPWAVLTLVAVLGASIAAVAVVAVMHGHKTTAKEAPPLASETLPPAAEGGLPGVATLEPIQTTVPGTDGKPPPAITGDGGKSPLPSWRTGSGPAPTTTSTGTPGKPPSGASTKPSGTIDLGY
jgi:eukaryotic-like serine/threonine-protein kinase